MNTKLYALLDPVDEGGDTLYGVFDTQEKAEAQLRYTSGPATIMEIALNEMLCDDGPHETRFIISTESKAGWFISYTDWLREDTWLGVWDIGHEKQGVISAARTHADACNQLIEHLKKRRESGDTRFPDIRDASELPAPGEHKVFSENNL